MLREIKKINLENGNFFFKKIDKIKFHTIIDIDDILETVEYSPEIYHQPVYVESIKARRI